uniref:Uncharacterized protein n=1 Tax=Rhizophora mucronata TaxID=61149 RepID=A0A2P2PBV4_RHIMU
MPLEFSSTSPRFIQIVGGYVVQFWLN